jgi:hypothetical protein
MRSVKHRKRRVSRTASRCETPDMVRRPSRTANRDTSPFGDPGVSQFVNPFVSLSANASANHSPRIPHSL